MLLLTWVIYHMAASEEVQERVYEELRSRGNDAEDLQHCLYTRRVLDESLRLSILAPFAARYQELECFLGNHHIPRGTPIIHALGVVLHHPTFWAHPHKFDPDRFLPENAKERPSLAFCPFGFAGKRKCPGYRGSLQAVVSPQRGVNFQRLDLARFASIENGSNGSQRFLSGRQQFENYGLSINLIINELTTMGRTGVPRASPSGKSPGRYGHGGVMVVLRGWRYVAFVAGIFGGVGLAIYPIIVAPYLDPSKYQDIQRVTRAGINQEDIQPGGMKVWTDPFEQCVDAFTAGIGLVELVSERYAGGTSEREVCQLGGATRGAIGEAHGEEIRGTRKVGEIQRDDLVARLGRVEEALRGFPSLPDLTGRVVLSSFDSTSSADSQGAVIETENMFHGLREVSLDEGSEGTVGAGEMSAGRAQAMSKGRGKTRALVIVGDSNVRRLEAAMGNDSGSRVSFIQFPGARIEHFRNKVGSVVCSESAEEVSVVLHVGTNDTPKSGSELMGRLKQAIGACREARSGVRVTVCAIPSRLDRGGTTWSRSETPSDLDHVVLPLSSRLPGHDRLKESCSAEGAGCVLSSPPK
ncbi:unnamed protein product [Darwinula stevensoni]|uniref:Uncharacterized protein n=1 Tax=Darwinula stevensoni TaxID=69355 RepID=A0A7R8X3V4_9CRUS|nr:unnamed protein product [Darwinula stevensoni]CAG0882951.1 unnamed protein product [Darwinula stevensoni]